MKKQILRYLKHISLTIVFLLALAVIIGLNMGASLHYGDHEARLNLNLEGPYIFFENDSTLDAQYILGNKDDGFYIAQKKHSIDELIEASCFFPLDSSSFEFTITTDLEIPASTYEDAAPIMAISDIEGGYKTFRDFLIANEVINENLEWTFGKGHLVLVGDFVDRGWSVTQVLWFIYKLEQDARRQGGHLHYIIGNHELKNMQGMYMSAAERYYAVAAILGKQHHHLYDSNAFIGRWLASKNSIERINGHLFVHGGLHPDLAGRDISLKEINVICRKNYFLTYFPKPEKTIDQLVLSNKTGISWYRGYFKDDLKQEAIDKTLAHFEATTVVVGHTLQSKVTSHYDGRVIGIDVKHGKDYHKSWPNQRSEGLLIANDKYYRVLHDGSKKEL